MLPPVAAQGFLTESRATGLVSLCPWTPLPNLPLVTKDIPHLCMDRSRIDPRWPLWMAFRVEQKEHVSSCRRDAHPDISD